MKRWNKGSEGCTENKENQMGLDSKESLTSMINSKKEEN